GCPHPRVVHHLAAAPPQLHPPAADPVRASDLGLQPPRCQSRSAWESSPIGKGPRMRIEALFLIFLGVFFGIVGLVYWFWSYEDGGGMMLLGTSLLGFVPGSYYFFWHR